MERGNSSQSERATVFDVIGLDGRTLKSVRSKKVRDPANLLDFDGSCLLWRQDRDGKGDDILYDVYVAATGSRSRRSCPGAR